MALTAGGRAGRDRGHEGAIRDTRHKSAKSLDVGWRLSVCADAYEAGGSFVAAYRPSDGGAGRHTRGLLGGVTADPERSEESARQRARGQIRRYCTANRLNRLGTLTYAGAGCHDPLEVRGHVRTFFKDLRSALGGSPFPYLWVPEWHKSGHGLHLHFAVGQYVRRQTIEASWGRGFVHIKLLSGLRAGSGKIAEARAAAGYLAKYVGKELDAGAQGLHRYEVAQGFTPVRVPIWGASEGQVISRANDLIGCAPSRVWRSSENPDWDRPPALWVKWM